MNILRHMPPPHPLPAIKVHHAVALMYHALAEDGVPRGQDPRYTLAEQRFRKQLQSIARHGGAGCARDWLDGSRVHRVLLTFDDGHASNHRRAFPALVEHGMRADFFVNPANVGKPGYADWSDLREMSAAGMSIQSHGYDHVYLTGLDARTLRDRLYAARIAIEDQVGTSVTLLAPPGGRMPTGLADVARQCGYRHVLSSRPGRISAHSQARILPRMAITTALDEHRFEAWIAGDILAISREQVRYGTLSLAKRLLGDSRYERVRTHALDGHGG